MRKTSPTPPTAPGAAGLVLAAGGAVMGLAAGLVAMAGRKMLARAADAMTGDWEDVLKAEHLLVGEIFDDIAATGPREKGRRRRLFARLRDALDRHALQEESVVYPALRLADPQAPWQELIGAHAEAKTLLFEIERLAEDDPRWMAEITRLRTTLEAHVREEEGVTFPHLRALLSKDQDAELTKLSHRAAMRLA